MCLPEEGREVRTAEPGVCGDWKRELGERQTEFRQLLRCLGLWGDRETYRAHFGSCA